MGCSLPECIRNTQGKGAVSMLHIALCGISQQDQELLELLQAYSPHPRELAPAMTHFHSAEQLLARLQNLSVI